MKKQFPIHIENNKLIKYGICTLIIGAILAIILPGIMTKNYSNFINLDFSNTGEIGDTIGGISGTIISFVGAILLYFAFIAQIEANNELKRQFLQERQLKHLDSLISQFKNELDAVKLSDELTGRAAIALISDRLSTIEIDNSDKNNYKNIEYLAKLSNALAILEYTLNKIVTYEMDNADKEICILMIKHHFDYYLKVHIEIIRDNTDCPEIIKEQITNILSLLSSIDSSNI